VASDLDAGLGQRAQVALEAPGKRVLDDRGDGDLSERRADLLSRLDRHFVEECQRAPDLHRFSPAVIILIRR
jgi:hypothetical protein